MDREDLLNEITAGLPSDNAHIARCLELAANEPDDLIRAFARLWLEHNCVAIARRLLEQ
jgi:hypothetical protein